MKEINRKAEGISTYGQQMFFTLGLVKNNADPVHHGRCQIFCPTVDSEDFKVEDLPWAWYISGFGGVTANPIVGRDKTAITGIVAYGDWEIPKNGAQVLVGFIDGNPENRFYCGAFYMPEHNRTLPCGVDNDGIKTEIDESGNYPQTEIPMYAKNQGEAGLYKDSPQYKFRGAYERSVAYPQNKQKRLPNTNGYWKKPLEGSKDDSQMYSKTTPGRHYILMSDIDEYCRIRIRTTEGTSIIFDDTNERIYVNTARGRNWVELDEGSGKVYIYSASKLNFHSENDMNFYSDSNINIVAKKRINIQSEERAVKIQSKLNTEILSTDANIKLTASRDFHIKTLNGPQGEKVEAKEVCNLPPYQGPDSPLGYTRDYEEEGGADTSQVMIETFDGYSVLVNDGFMKLTAKENVDMRSTDSTVKIQAGDELHLKADSDMNFETDTSFNVKAGQDASIESEQTLNLKAGQNANLEAGQTLNLKGQLGANLESSLSTNVKGLTTSVEGTATLNLAGAATAIGGAALVLVGATIQSTTAIQLGGGGVGPAGSAGSADSADNADGAEMAEEADEVEFDEIQPKMIVPKHEPWERDEDEANCKTPRNPSYQG